MVELEFTSVMESPIVGTAIVFFSKAGEVTDTNPRVIVAGTCRCCRETALASEGRKRVVIVAPFLLIFVQIARFLFAAAK